MIGGRNRPIAANPGDLAVFRWRLRTGMLRLRLGRMLALVMHSQTAPGLLHRVVNGNVRRRERMRFAAGAMPLPGKATGDSHYANGIRVRVEHDFLDMNDLGCRHQRRGTVSHGVQAGFYGKDA